MPKHDPRTDARTEPTAVYEATTRTRTLAPKLARMVAVSEGPVYVFITCGQRTPDARERADWENAIRALVRNGARIVHFLTPDTGEEEANLARALTDEFPQCDWIPIVRSEVEKLGLARFHYVIAWEGAVEAPRQALLWIERAREGDELKIGAELYDSTTLRRVSAPFRKCTKTAVVEVLVTSWHLLRYLFDSLSSSPPDGLGQALHPPCARHFQTDRLPTISPRR